MTHNLQDGYSVVQLMKETGSVLPNHINVFSFKNRMGALGFFNEMRKTYSNYTDGKIIEYTDWDQYSHGYFDKAFAFAGLTDGLMEIYILRKNWK